MLNKEKCNKNDFKYLRLLIILLFMLSFISLNSIYVKSLTLLSPQEMFYETNKEVEKLKINVDYINPYEETWLIVNNQRIDLRKENLIQQFSMLESINIPNTKRVFNLNEISNYIEYSFSILMTGRGMAELNLSNNENSFGIRYLNDWANEVWQCYNGFEYVNIGEAKRRTNYNFLIKIFNDGLKYDYYEVWINNEKKAVCEIHDEIKSIKEIIIDVDATSANISNQILKSGSYNIELPSGKHEVTLFAKDGDEEFSIKKEFYVVIRECGNLICENLKTYINCPSDCKEIFCDDNALIGDTNNDGIVNVLDKTNLINIIEGRIPKPERDCCVDLSGDGKVGQKDLEIIDKIIRGEIPTERCYTGCSDGTFDNTCSRNKPFFCDYGNLFEDCENCGCPQNSICMKDGSCFDLNECKCSDVASSPNNPLGYDNLVNEFDLILIEQHLGLCEGEERFNPKLDLNFDGCIDKRDIECIMFNFNKTTLCAGTQVCRDGTFPEQCSTRLPMFCEDNQLIFNCQKCGCPPYTICSNDGTCNTLGNFEIIIEEKDSNKSKRYMEGGSIYIPLFRDSFKEIEFIINPLRNLENITFRVNLEKDGEIFKDLHDINTELSRRINLKEGEQHKIKINFEDNRNPLGLYKGDIKVLINGYEFSTIPLEMELRESVLVPFVEIREIDYTKFIPYLSAILFMILILIYLFIRRRKERKFIRSLELENKIILK